MFKNTIARMSLVCALAPLATACVEEPPVTDVPPGVLFPSPAGEAVDSAPAALSAQGSAAAHEYLYPREAKVQGKGYEEWAAEWWQWVLAIPKDVNPNFDGPCDVAQPDGMFFLGGNFGGTSARSCEVPVGTPIFFPVLNAFVSNCPELAGGSYTCELAMSQDYAHDTAEWLMDLETTMSLTIDGVAVEDLEEYRAHTASFPTIAPADADDRIHTCSGAIRENTCGVPVGSPRGTVSDGHWAMVRPLPPGEHQIHFTGGVPSFGFSLDITYDIVVAP
jgi:hypothetical protein